MFHFSFCSLISQQVYYINTLLENRIQIKNHFGPGNNWQLNITPQLIESIRIQCHSNLDLDLILTHEKQHQNDRAYVLTYQLGMPILLALFSINTLNNTIKFDDYTLELLKSTVVGLGCSIVPHLLYLITYSTRLNIFEERARNAEKSPFTDIDIENVDFF